LQELLQHNQLILVQIHKEFIKLPSNRKGCIFFITQMIHERPLDIISLGRMFGNFDRNMERKLMMELVGILLHIKKPKQPFRKVLPLFRQIMHIFRPQTKRTFKHLYPSKIKTASPSRPNEVIENPSIFSREEKRAMPFFPKSSIFF